MKQNSWIFMALVHSIRRIWMVCTYSPYPKEFLFNETKPYTTSRCSQHRHSRLMQKLIQTLKHSFTKEHPMDDFGKQQEES
jgi:hypothetical protein